MLNGNITINDAGEKFIFVLAPGHSEPLTAHQSHPNWSRIQEQFLAQDEDGFADLFDIPATVERAFQRLSERVTAKNGKIYFDGDEVHGTIVEAILGFMEAGEEVGPLVNFFEKLTTNPLGNVQDGLFSWITGQKSEGNFTITPEGDILGYKSVKSTTPQWRGDHDIVYVPSRTGGGIVNGVEVSNDQFIEQVPGDVVEMPRSRVLNEPSAACGDGLHIGTYAYAKTFYGGNTVMLVKFSPRDIVSLPDSNSTWKLRVCRYTVLGPVDAPLDVPLYNVEQPVDDDDLDVSLDAEQSVADLAAENELRAAEAAEAATTVTFGSGSAQATRARQRTAEARERVHGKGGATSQAAKGRGRNPAQDEAGKFSAGRPGSKRDGSGRFAG